MGSTSSADVRRGTRLDARDPAVACYVLDHPEQLSAESAIEELIRHLRGCTTAEDYDDLQRALFQATYVTDQKRATVARNVKRQERGRPTPAGNWALELYVADRVARQLRCVGDAIAWRCYGFDRLPMIALSNNQPPSPLVGKEGLGYELGAAVESFEQRGNFTLLHDLTNTLRVGDITEFTPGGPRVGEIKASTAGASSQRAARQRQRLEQAIAAVNDGSPLGPSGRTLVRTNVSLRTQLDQLSALIDRSRDERFVVEAVGEQLVVTVLRIDGPDLDVSEQHEIAAHVEALQEGALSDAGLLDVRHRLRVHGTDHRDATAAVAPYSIFPFKPDVCAGLVTDRIVVVATLGWDQLASEFQRVGWTTSCPLPESNSSLPPDVLVASKGRATVTVHSTAILQALLEMHQIPAFVAGLVDAAERQHEGGAVIAFDNEEAVWR